MHVGLSKVLAIEDQSPIPEPLTNSAQLKHFAREAEVNENFELAAKYYQEVRIRLLIKQMATLFSQCIHGMWWYKLCFFCDYRE